MAATVVPLRHPSPRLRLVHGRRAEVAARYRRRRLAVVVAAAVLLGVVLVLANAAVASVAGGGSAVPAAGDTSGAGVYVVQPGDTVWSIAAATAPDLDVRLAVDRLVDLNGRSPLVPGQHLVLPAPPGA